MNALQYLSHETQVVLAPRRIEQLILYCNLFRFSKDREAEFGNEDGFLEGIVEVREVCAKVRRRYVDV